jgi:hypothetical protein
MLGKSIKLKNKAKATDKPLIVRFVVLFVIIIISAKAIAITVPLNNYSALPTFISQLFFIDLFIYPKKYEISPFEY